MLSVRTEVLCAVTNIDATPGHYLVQVGFKFHGSCELLPHLLNSIHTYYVLHRPGKVKCAMMNEIRSLEWRREDLSFSCIKLLA